MFWEVPDDPRGALRWSLSKIRPLVDEPGIYPSDRRPANGRAAHRERRYRLFAAQACAEDTAAATGDLARAASCFRGPLLADLDLAETSGFHTWLLGAAGGCAGIAAREFSALDRAAHGDAGSGVALCARTRARRSARRDRVGAVDRCAGGAGRIGEIRRQYEVGLRSLREIGGGSGPLLRAWRAAQAATGRPAVDHADANPAPPADTDPPRSSCCLSPISATTRSSNISPTGSPGT